MGTWNSGKSKSWNDIAQWARKGDAPYQFYVLDTDKACERMEEEFDSYHNVIWEDVWDWPEFIGSIDKFTNKASRDDWLIIDMVDKAWEKVQDYFVEQVHGTGAAKWFLDFKKEGGSAHPLAGGYGINWTIINKQYADFVGKFLRWPGHILCATPADTVQKPTNTSSGDSSEILANYGRYGVKPRGQKHLGHLFHTVLWTHQAGEEWKLTTIKDRGGRKGLGSVKWSDFVGTYLVPVAGWKL
jgi:hypothetical protein